MIKLLRASSGVSFSPLDIAGCILWFKSDTDLYTDTGFTTPVTVNGDLIAGWKDQSGNNNHIIQATAGSRPVYDTVTTQNSKVSVSTDGIAQTMSRASITLGNNVTVFCVYTTLQTSGSRSVFKIGIDSNYVMHSHSAAKYGWYTLGAPRNTTTPSAAGIQINTWKYDSSSLTGKFYKNGSQSGGDVVIPSVAWNNVPLFPSGNFSFMAGNFWELLVYNSALSDVNLAAINAYLNTRYMVY